MDQTQTVDAIYITATGLSFDCQAVWPHENFITRAWKYSNNEDEEETLVDFVYFGTYRNRLVYHEIRLEQTATLC